MELHCSVVECFATTKEVKTPSRQTQYYVLSIFIFADASVITVMCFSDGDSALMYTAFMSGKKKKKKSVEKTEYLT